MFSTKEKDKSYKECLNKWYTKNKGLLFYLVLFKDNEITSMPEMYIASADELYNHLKKGFFGSISLTLYYDYCPKKGTNKCKVQKLPSDLVVSRKRIEKYFREA